MSDRLYWIWLSLVFGTGTFLSDALLDRFEYDAKNIYEAEPDEYAGLDGIETVLPRLANKDMSEAQQISAYCQGKGIGLLTPRDGAYTQRLRNIRSKPVLLYYKGKLCDLDDLLCISTVGTRHMTQYGQQSAYTVAHELARAGAVIVSGMALGIDGVCHRACLDAGGYTVAVLGCGIDRAYPPEHAALMNEIIAYGLVVSEFRPFTGPYGTNFPIRNRIISGLSQGTVVIEGSDRSGALITARDALYQGRDLFAIPGKVGEQTSSGPNMLIQNGAKMVTGAEDILAEYAELYPKQIDMTRMSRFAPRYTKSPLDRFRRDRTRAGANNISVPPPPESPSAPDPKGQEDTFGNKAVRADISSLSAEEYRVLTFFREDDAVSADKLIAAVGKPGEAVLLLTNMEMTGFIKTAPGGLYVLDTSRFSRSELIELLNKGEAVQNNA